MTSSVIDRKRVENSASTGRVPRSMFLSLAVTVNLTLASWLYALLNHLRGLPKPYSWPYYALEQSTVLPHGDRFGDLTISMERFHHFGQADFFSPLYGAQFLYPAPMALFYRIFLPTFVHPQPEFFALVAITILVAALIFLVRLEENGLARVPAAVFIALTVLFSPVLAFDLQRCNLEIIPFIFVATFLYLLMAGRPVLAGVIVGGAIALKLYPVILLGLLLAKKEFRATAAASFSTGVWMLLGLFTETSSISESARGTSQGLLLFSRDYAEKVHAAIGWDHSAFSIVKLAVSRSGGSITHALHVYLPLAAAAGLVCYGFRVWKLPAFNQITALSIFSILLPPVSFEYTLMQMFPSFALFCCMAVRQRSDEGMAKRFDVLGVCFGLLFSLLGFTVVHGHIIEGQLKSLVLIFLLVYVLKFPFHDAVLDADSALAVQPSEA